MSKLRLIVGLVTAICGSLSPVTVLAPNVIAPNINSQQTAYYDYQGGPVVVRVNYPPTKMELVINKELYTCPKFVTRYDKCKYNNAIEVVNEFNNKPNIKED